MKKSTAKTITRIIAAFGFACSLFMFLAGVFLIVGSTFFISLIPYFSHMLGQVPVYWIAGSFVFTLGMIMVLVGMFRFWVAYSLWEFRKWSRIVEIIIAIFWLFAFPLGTVLAALKIYFLGFNDDIRKLFR